MTLKIEEHKQDNITYHQQTTKRNEINQHSDPTNVRIHNVYNSISRENYDQKFDKTNIRHAVNQTPRINPVEVVITESEGPVKENEMGKLLYQLVNKTVISRHRHRRIPWESIALQLFQVNVSRRCGEENCRSTR